MQKLDFLKTLLGEELYGRFIESVGQKEGAAALVGMVTKETETPVEPEPEPTPEPEPKKTEEPGVDVKAALAEALATQLQPLLADMQVVKQSVADIKATQDTDRTALDNRLKVVETSVKEATDGVSDLRGDKTRAQNRRASQSDQTITNKQTDGPQNDPDNSFADFLFGRK